MKSFPFLLLPVCCVLLSHAALAQDARDYRRGEGPYAQAGDRRERREMMREELRRQPQDGAARGMERSPGAPGLRRLDPSEREELRRQMREAAREADQDAPRERGRRERR